MGKIKQFVFYHFTRIFGGIRRAFSRWYNSDLDVVLESIVIGVLTGFVVAAFRHIISLSNGLRTSFYENFLKKSSPWWIVLFVFALIALGLFLGWAAKVRPMIRGSGIPQVKGVLQKKMVFNKWRTELPLKFIAGILGLGAGLSLGREGPSIQIGAYVGRGALSVLKRPIDERRYLLSAASAAGLSAAFSAPLAGVLFIQEELLSEFSPLLLACGMGASLAAEAAVSVFLGSAPSFSFASIGVLPVPYIPWIILLGILCGLIGHFFKKCLYAGQDLYKVLKIPEIARPIIPLLMTIPIGFFLIDALGGGHDLIQKLAVEKVALGMLLLLLAVKIIYTSICYGTGTAGGIFLPLLTCGAILADAFGECLEGAGFIAADTGLNFIVLGMGAFFTAVVGAPLTGIVLILEMAANFNHLGNLILCCLSAYMTVRLLNSKPVYTELLDRML
ncbi:MAG: ClC family H(+)/Cl(-) exchange transporter [Spirochaetaceae bacterium]|jgi:H+/Cl- antiporter ClcA|nr:ClC family H(+)/Cl(-) exchange transporter [Spirochaetaceae bacterium]